MTRSIYKGPFSEIKIHKTNLLDGRSNQNESTSSREFKKRDLSPVQNFKQIGDITGRPFYGRISGKLRLWSRCSVILPENVGLDCEVHNGKRFVPLKVREEMVGHRFGEFALTRKRPQHKSSKKKRR